MTFEEWWGVDRDRTLAYDLMNVLTEAAKQAWHAGHVTSIEEMLEKWNRTGVDIDAALHGRVNEQSPIANRLRMIAAAQPKWQPIETAPKDKDVLLVGDEGEIVAGGWFMDRNGWYVNGVELERLCFEPTLWMPMPPLPEPPND